MESHDCTSRLPAPARDPNAPIIGRASRPGTCHGRRREARLSYDDVRVDIPYESLDPLTIGSCDDPSTVYREEIGFTLPRRNLWAWVKPSEPRSPSPEATTCGVCLPSRLN